MKKQPPGGILRMLLFCLSVKKELFTFMVSGAPFIFSSSSKEATNISALFFTGQSSFTLNSSLLSSVKTDCGTLSA